MSPQVDLLKFLSNVGNNRGWNGPLRLDLASLGHAVPSYSIDGEDLRIRRYFRDKIMSGESGIYVDVGCSHPFGMSNTFLLYSYGWRGLCIDADNRRDAYATTRPEDTFVHAAVGEKAETVYWFRHKKDRGMSRIFLTPQADDNFENEMVPVQARPLNSLLSEHMSGKMIDLLAIDVEGGELGVLRSNNWTMWRPKLVVFECHEFRFEEPYATPTVAFMKSIGYVLGDKVGPNVFMVDATVNKGF